MQRERASATRSASDRKLPPHGLDDAFGQGQTKPRAVNLRGRHRRAPIKRLKNMPQFLGSYPNSAIRDADLNFLPGHSMLGKPRLNSYPFLFAAVFQCVGNQILHALRKRREVAHDLRQVGLDLLFHVKSRRSISPNVPESAASRISGTSSGRRL